MKFERSSRLIELTYVVFFVFVSLYILSRSYFFGMMTTPDSTGYLRESYALSNGLGFRYNGAVSMNDYFSMWPIGYPLSIFLSSIILQVDVYLASKVLSVIIGLEMLLLYYTFKEKSALLFLFFLNPGFIEIHLYSWSEQLFIFSILVFIISLSKLIMSSSVKSEITHFIVLIISGMFIFLSRYIGAFIFIVVFIVIIQLKLSFRLVRNKRRKMLYLIIFEVIFGLLVSLYLAANYFMTGYITGMGRLPIILSKIELFNELILALNNELFSIIRMTQLPFLVSLVVLSFMFYGRYSFRSKNEVSKFTIDQIASTIFIQVSFVYFICLVVLRFSANFDAFNSRLLVPCSIFMFFGLVLKFEFKLKYQSQLTHLLLIFSLILLILPYYYDKIVFMRFNNSIVDLGYERRSEILVSKYCFVQEESIVLWADRDILYKRIDVARIEPEKAPNYHKETLDAFLTRIEKFDRVYIDIEQLKIDLINHRNDYHFTIYNHFSRFLNESEKVIIYANR